MEIDENFIDLSGDNGVLKKVITPGDNDKGTPPPASTVKVHYIGKLTDGTIFDNSYSRNVPVVFRLGQEMVIKGWDICVATMLTGEKCKLKLSPEYGYGSEGSATGGSVNIPSDATIEFEMELVNFEKPIDTVPDRVEAANKRKDEGNQYFKEGKIPEAIKAYEQGLYFFEHIFPKSDSPDYVLMNQCKLPMFLNLAACHIKMQNWSDARINCEKSLDIDENNVKAIFRRGQAHQGAGNYDKARTDFKTAIEKDPKSTDLKKALINLDKQEQLYKEKEKNVYSKMFV
jgi:peptidylprolyl isomerase